MRDGEWMRFSRLLVFVLAENDEIGEACPIADALGDIAFGFKPASVPQSLTGLLFENQLGGMCFSPQFRRKLRNRCVNLAWLVSRRDVGWRRDMQAAKASFRAVCQVHGKANALAPDFVTADMNQKVAKHVPSHHLRQ